MSWNLHVWTPNAGALRATYTNVSPGGIAQGFRWSVRGDGSSLQLQFSARPSQVNIGPRDVVQLVINGQAAFYGYVDRAWPSDDDEMREYVALGAARLLERRLMDGADYGEQDVAYIVRNIISRLRHPAIKYSSTYVPTTGRSIEMHQASLIPLSRIFDDLVASVADTGVTWGVNASGYFFFKAVTGSASTDYANSGLRWLPIDGDDVVTKVELFGGYDKWKTPLIYAYTSGYHATYGAEKGAAVAPDILDISTPDHIAWDGDLKITSDGGSSWDAASGTASELSTLWDQDNLSGLRAIGSQTDSSCSAALSFRGLRLQWDAHRPINAVYVSARTNKASGLAAVAFWQSGGVDQHAVLRGLNANFEGIIVVDKTINGLGLMQQFPCSNIGDWDIQAYEFRPLIWGARAHDIAAGMIRLPEQHPLEARWAGYQPPRPVLTVTGTPSGTVSGQVETWEYTWTPRQMESVARLGSPGGDAAARAIGIVANQRRLEAETTGLVVTRRS